ncbi:hypothetical protein [Streptomyces lunaelactis]|uniref:hypothetical protein n=1 Tax=Streptomyces lunaelactis TaxID=1535768 RepID=UPI002681564E|nr:hypothetical protein [Streptomyces lunaelactis]
MKTSGSGTDRITVEEAAERIGHGREDEAARRVDTSVLLDVRELDEWSAGTRPEPYTVPSPNYPMARHCLPGTEGND